MFDVSAQMLHDVLVHLFAGALTKLSHWFECVHKALRVFHDGHCQNVSAPQRLSGPEVDLGIRSGETRWVVKLLEDSVFDPNHLIAPTTSAQRGGQRRSNACCTVGSRRPARVQTRGQLARKRRAPLSGMITCSVACGWPHKSSTTS